MNIIIIYCKIIVLSKLSYYIERNDDRKSLTLSVRNLFCIMMWMLTYHIWKEEQGPPCILIIVFASSSDLYSFSNRMLITLYELPYKFKTVVACVVRVVCRMHI
jgi:hypothetical protein